MRALQRTSASGDRAPDRGAPDRGASDRGAADRHAADRHAAERVAADRPPQAAPSKARVIATSKGRADWPEIEVTEGSDGGGIVYNRSESCHRVFMLTGGEVETWWTAGGVGRWRRAFPGAMSLSAPGPCHNSSWTGERRYAYVSFTPRFMASIVGDHAVRRLEATPPHFCLHEYYAHAAEGQALTQGLRGLLAADEPEAGMRAEELAIRLALWMTGLAGCTPQPDPAEGLNRAQLRRVVEKIDAGLGRPITLAELAEVAGVSPFHFCRRFRLNTGVSPWQFVLRWRVDRAARMLLADRNAGLSNVATACGFVDQSHLTRVFKRVRGVTPGAFAAAYVGRL